MTLIDVICRENAFRRGWETPNDHFPLPVAQSLTQFQLKSLVVFFSSFDHHLSTGTAQGKVQQSCCNGLQGSVVAPVCRLWNVGQWMDGDSWLLHKWLKGGSALGTGHRGMIVGNPHLSGAGWLPLSECAPRARGFTSRGRGQAWAHRAWCHFSTSWQSLGMLLFNATEPVCQLRGDTE